jgi:hypothetical protein
MQSIVKFNGLVKPCCMPGNMEKRKSLDPDVRIESCRTCGARHYTANASMRPFFKSPMKGRGMIGWTRDQLNGLFLPRH